MGGNPVSFNDPTGLMRPLDPNSAECQALRRKIENKKNDIKKRTCEAEANPDNLPYLPPYPGAPPRASVQGHEMLIQELQGYLASDEALYAAKCGGGGGAAPAPVTTPDSNPVPSVDPKTQEQITKGVATVGVGALVLRLILPIIVAF